jgi:hypothetical protein
VLLPSIVSFERLLRILKSRSCQDITVGSVVYGLVDCDSICRTTLLLQALMDGGLPLLRARFSTIQPGARCFSPLPVALNLRAETLTFFSKVLCSKTKDSTSLSPRILRLALEVDASVTGQH